MEKQSLEDETPPYITRATRGTRHTDVLSVYTFVAEITKKIGFVINCDKINLKFVYLTSTEIAFVLFHLSPYL